MRISSSEVPCGNWWPSSKRAATSGKRNANGPSMNSSCSNADSRIWQISRDQLQRDYQDAETQREQLQLRGEHLQASISDFKLRSRPC